MTLPGPSSPYLSAGQGVLVSEPVAHSGAAIVQFRIMQNVLEESVQEIFLRLRDMEAGYCHCLRCQDDVITHALNHAKPRYVSGSAIGSAVTRVSVTRDQTQAEMAVLVLEAMRRVQRNPRHGPEGFVPLGAAVR